MERAGQVGGELRRLIAWADGQSLVRAMLLTSTRAIPSGVVDVFSDYDVILVAADIQPFFEDRAWVEDFGHVLVPYWDPIHPDPEYGLEQVSNVIQYQDGLKIDFTVWPIELLRRIAAAPELPAELDAGYRILVDKDGLTEGMQAPTYRAYVLAPPSEQAYQTVVVNFFSDAPYVAKNLWRDQLMPAKQALEFEMKYNYLLRMLEWRVQVDHGWALKAGVLGKGLKQRLPPAIWAQLEACFVGSGEEENWTALFKTIELFRQVAVDVGDHLGYAYPHELDQRVVAYLRKVQRLQRSATSFG